MNTDHATNRGRGTYFICARALALGVVAVAAALATCGAGPAWAGKSRATIDQESDFSPSDTGYGAASAKCNGDMHAVGGGVITELRTADSVLVLASGPLDGTGSTLKTRDGNKAKQWYASIVNEDFDDITVFVFALCSSSSTATIEATLFKVADGATGEALAKCPDGKRALGGGMVQIGNDFGHDFNQRVRASGPLDATGITAETRDGDEATQWYAAVLNQSGEERSFKVFAICASDSPATIETTQYTVKPHANLEVREACPGSKRVVGGGVVQNGSPEGWFVRASGPLELGSGGPRNTEDGDKATKWYAVVFNDSAEERTFRVLAICE